MKLVAVERLVPVTEIVIEAFLKYCDRMPLVIVIFTVQGPPILNGIISNTIDPLVTLTKRIKTLVVEL